MFKKAVRIRRGNRNNSGQRSFSASLQENIALLQSILSDDEMIVYRYFREPKAEEIRYCLIFSHPISGEKTINDRIIRPIMENLMGKNIPQKDLSNYIVNQVVQVRGIEETSDVEKAVQAILYGDTILLIEGFSKVLVICTKDWITRAVTEPQAETVVRGPREGFTESIVTNISLLERKIVNPDLKFKYMELGNVTKTKICICYIKGIASEKILNEVEIRLKKIQIDGILDSGYIQEMIKDSPYSAFDTIGDTERPDVVAGKLLEGRVGIICDGSPSVLTMPFLFLEYFQTNEDYYTNYIFASINRFLRVLCYFLTVSIPAVYLAIISFHQEMLPTPLILSIAAARYNVPFPSIVELVLMLLVFEVMREAGVRLPSTVGMAISIVGALVLGEAAVSAKIISAPIVIITAFTGICSFLVFRLKGPVIVTRIYLLLASSTLGLFGYMIALIALFVYLISLRSFGVPYMMNISLIDIDDVRDTSIRAPLKFMNKRPKFAMKRNRTRAGGGTR